MGKSELNIAGCHLWLMLPEDYHGLAISHQLYEVLNALGGEEGDDLALADDDLPLAPVCLFEGLLDVSGLVDAGVLGLDDPAHFVEDEVAHFLLHLDLLNVKLFAEHSIYNLLP